MAPFGGPDPLEADMARRRTGVQRAQAMSQPALDRVQSRRVRQLQSSPYNTTRVSKAEQQRRASDPNRASKQATTHRAARTKQARQYQKDASRAMQRDLQTRRAVAQAGRSTARRAAMGAARAAGAAGLVATVADAIGSFVDSRAEQQRQARARYNAAMGGAPRGTVDTSSANRALRVRRRASANIAPGSRSRVR